MRAIAFCVLVLCVLIALSRLCDHATQSDPREKARWIISKRNETYDFAVLGASKAYAGIDIKAMERELGQTGINLAMDGTTFPEQYLALALFLEHNNVHHLILDVAPSSFDNDAFKVPFRPYPYFGMMDRDLVFTNLQQNFGWRAYAWRYVPFFKNAEFNSQAGLLPVYTWLKHRLTQRTPELEFDETGSRFFDKPFYQEGMARKFNYLPKICWNIDALPKRYFFEMLQLAKARNIQMTIIMSPEYKVWSDMQPTRHDVEILCREAAGTNGAFFVSFHDDELARHRTNFIDTAHLNKAAATVFSVKVASVIKTRPQF